MSHKNRAQQAEDDCVNDHFVVCCSPVQDAYSEVASLFAEFFRDLDIVPSDIIAGLVLLRQRQRSKRSAILDQVSLSIKNIYMNVCIFVLA